MFEIWSLNHKLYKVWSPGYLDGRKDKGDI